MKLQIFQPGILDIVSDSFIRSFFGNFKNYKNWDFNIFVFLTIYQDWNDLSKQTDGKLEVKDVRKY